MTAMSATPIFDTLARQHGIVRIRPLGSLLPRFEQMPPLVVKEPTR